MYGVGIVSISGIFYVKVKGEPTVPSNTTVPLPSSPFPTFNTLVPGSAGYITNRTGSFVAEARSSVAQKSTITLKKVKKGFSFRLGFPTSGSEAIEKLKFSSKTKRKERCKGREKWKKKKEMQLSTSSQLPQNFPGISFSVLSWTWNIPLVPPTTKPRPDQNPFNRIFGSINRRQFLEFFQEKTPPV